MTKVGILVLYTVKNSRADMYIGFEFEFDFVCTKQFAFTRLKN